MPRHPAKFSKELMPVLATSLVGCRRILDPFAGTGRIHDLNGMVEKTIQAGRFSHRVVAEIETVGVEIEPEWAAMHPQTVVGDALALPFPDASFDGVCTSPCYGNRMSDHHEAKDDSRRNTYRHALGRPLSPGSAGMLQWGHDYKVFHAGAWGEVWRVLRPGGRFVLNIKDHIRNGVIQQVTAWHVDCITSFGFIFASQTAVETPGQRQGANRDQRVDYESVIVFMKPVPGGALLEGLR